MSPFQPIGGARFFEVDPHDKKELIGNLLRQMCQSLGIVDGGLWVVDGAGAHDHHEAAVLVP